MVLEGGCLAEDWKEPAPLQVSQLAARPDGSLLLMVQAPTYLCRTSNAALPVIVDARGRWRWGDPVEGLVTRIAPTPEGGLVAISQWQIEGTYPTLLVSADGLSWVELPLPEPRETRGPDEVAPELCVVEGRLLLRLESELEEKRQSWTRPLGMQAPWAPAGELPCPPPGELSAGWKLEQSAQEIVLSAGARRIVLPAQLRPRRAGPPGAPPAG